VTRRRRNPLRGPASAPAVGTLAGLALAVAVFMPWYAVNISSVFVERGTSGWNATTVAKAVLVLAIVAIIASAALTLDARGAVPLDAGLARLLGWLLLGASAVAAVLVGYRLIALPGPAPEFLSRETGLFLAMAAAVAGVVAGVSQLAARS
jgi:hypothetical protein